MTALFYESGFYMLSNFSAHAVSLNDILYPTAEHAYQAAKFTDGKVRNEILHATSPMQAKLVAQKHAVDKKQGWHEQKLLAMENVLRAKLVQHAEVQDALVRSKNEEIVEDSPVDYFWGRGADGKGQNQLGKLWMKLREESV
jgi:ribA/ribD-fused uncharacterized protein